MATLIMTGRYTTEAIQRISGERATKATDTVQQDVAHWMPLPELPRGGMVV